MRIENNSKLVMIGDSITDEGRGVPIGETVFDGLGLGYVSLVASILEATVPEKNIRIVNMGISGNTVNDLKARWDTDVTALNPDWVCVMIGINDIWRQFDCRLIKEGHIDIGQYKEILESLVKTTLPNIKGLVLMTPFFIEGNKSDSMRIMTDEYGAVVKVISEQYKTVFVDTQAAFDDVLVKLHPMSLSRDRVHPNKAGSYVIARAFLNAIGYTW